MQQKLNGLGEFMDKQLTMYKNMMDELIHQNENHNLTLMKAYKGLEKA